MIRSDFQPLPADGRRSALRNRWFIHESLPAKGAPRALGSAVLFLLLLLSADVAFIFVHAAHVAAHSTNLQFLLDTEHGHPEVFQYIKLFWTVVLLLALWQRSRGPVFLPWALLFLYLLCDDAFQIHEYLGAQLATLRGLPAMAALQSRDVGELAVSAGAGLILLGLIALRYRGSAPAAKTASKGLVAILLGIAFFGVAMDLLHALVGNGYLGLVLVIVEDGGEMFAVSAGCAYVLQLLGCLPTSEEKAPSAT